MASESTDRRELIALRVSPTAMAEVRRLAASETDGNTSKMLRILLGEGLAARTLAERRRS